MLRLEKLCPHLLMLCRIFGFFRSLFYYSCRSRKPPLLQKTLFLICILFIGTFRRPNWIRQTLLTIFKLPVLRHWYSNVDVVTNNLVHASYDLRNRSFWFWFKAFGLTILTWAARFLVVNAIFLAFSQQNFNHLVVFARQLILWIIMVITPTPGGSGISEYAFKEYYSDIFSTSSAIIFVTLIWRIISYYLYLILGILVIPNWIKKSFTKNTETITALNKEKTTN